MIDNHSLRKANLHCNQSFFSYSVFYLSSYGEDLGLLLPYSEAADVKQKCGDQVISSQEILIIQLDLQNILGTQKRNS